MPPSSANGTADAQGWVDYLVDEYVHPSPALADLVYGDWRDTTKSTWRIEANDTTEVLDAEEIWPTRE